MEKKIALQHKILTGYAILVAVIGSMAATLLHERNRVFEIETEMRRLNLVQRDVNTAHRYITRLAMRGETALAWEEANFEEYRSLRLQIDTMLQIMHKGNEEFVSRAQIDTLRHLLANKEEYLYQIMQLFHEQEEADSLLPVVAQQAVQPRTVTRKKKGIAGWFGAKETVQVPPNTTRLNTLSEKLLSIQEERQEAIDTYTDSLRNHNKELNRKLRTLINTMNEQTEQVLEAKSRHLQESYDRSMHLSLIHI